MAEHVAVVNGEIQCLICKTKLQHGRNYSDAFVEGIVGSAITKVDVVKHESSDQYARALSYGYEEKNP